MKYTLEGTVLSLDIFGCLPMIFIEETHNGCIIARTKKAPVEYALFHIQRTPEHDAHGRIKKWGELIELHRVIPRRDRFNCVKEMRSMAHDYVSPPPPVVVPPAPPKPEEPMSEAEQSLLKALETIHQGILDNNPDEREVEDLMDLIMLDIAFSPVLPYPCDDTPCEVEQRSDGMYTVFIDRSRGLFKNVNEERLKRMRARFIWKRDWYNKHMHLLPYHEKARVIFLYFGGYWLDLEKFRGTKEGTTA